jgi:superfamily II DNA or RNA helicase
MNYRDQLQDKWAETAYQSKHGILHLCPRAGKTRTCIRMFCKVHRLYRESYIDKNKHSVNILICYPDKNIQESWESDFKAIGYKNSNIKYITHTSLKKEIGNKYDIIICDEIHLLSENQKVNFKKIMDSNISSWIIGLSGTLSKNTEIELGRDLKLKVITKYSLYEAIKDGLISDYKINVIKVPLDNKKIVDLKKKKTEKGKYDAICWVIKNKGQNLFLSLSRMRLLHNSISRTEATKKLLKNLVDRRLLVFCSSNDIANKLGCKIHTSKFKNQEEFEKFIQNTSGYNHMAVCKIGNTGVSFKSLDHIVVQAFDSNSENLTQRICRSLILDEKGKISNIYIICSDEEVELKWLEKSLEFFDKSKIKYL